MDDVRTPFIGRLVPAVPGYPEWHNFGYENDPSIYVYKLAEYYAFGDLEIIVEGIQHQPNSVLLLLNVTRFCINVKKLLFNI